jgi:hypothetical protein
MRLVIIDHGEIEIRDVADLGLTTLQRAVGGYIEPIFTVPSCSRRGYQLTAYANDEGAGECNVFCPPHQHAIRGPIAIAGLDPMGDTVESTDEELKQLVIIGVIRDTENPVPPLLVTA